MPGRYGRRRDPADRDPGPEPDREAQGEWGVQAVREALNPVRKEAVAVRGVRLNQRIRLRRHPAHPRAARAT